MTAFVDINAAGGAFTTGTAVPDVNGTTVPLRNGAGRDGSVSAAGIIRNLLKKRINRCF